MTGRVRSETMNIDLFWAMQIFINVVESGSFSNAAKHLGLANSSVTSCIRNLETHLGVTLLHRTTRDVHLTDEGSAFYAHSVEIVSRVDEAKASVVQSRQLSGTLRIEMPIALGHLVLGPALIEFAAEYPDLRVVVGLTNDVSRLIKRGVDVAIRMDEVDDGDLVAHWLFEAKHSLCASPQFLRSHGTPLHPADIRPELCMGYTPNFWSEARTWQFRCDGELFEINPGANLAFNSTDALMESAVKGGGYVYALDVLAQNYLRRGELVTVLPDWATATQTFYAVYPRSRHVQPKVQCFLEFLHNIFRVRPTEDSVTVPPLVARR